MTTTTTVATTTWIGLDISKDTIEVCLLRHNGKTHFKQFFNTSSGHAKLLRWAQHLDEGGTSHFCMESTGSYSCSYSCEVALFLAQAAQKVSVINPALIHFFARSQGQGNKTDKADAHIIALFCRKEHPDVWRAAAPEVRELAALKCVVIMQCKTSWCRRRTAFKHRLSPKPC